MAKTLTMICSIAALASARRMPSRIGVLRGGQSEAEPINEALYSRQLYVLGHAAQHSLAKSKVLVIGLSGLGAELSKNLALAGVKELHVHDETPATLHDLAASFLLTDADVGTPRATRAVEQLAALNPHVDVRRLTGPVDAETLREHGHTVVVAVGAAGRKVRDVLACDATLATLSAPAAQPLGFSQRVAASAAQRLSVAMWCGADWAAQHP